MTELSYGRLTCSTDVQVNAGISMRVEKRSHRNIQPRV
jgi:hypothetical protein